MATKSSGWLALTVVLVLLGGAVGVYARAAMMPPKNFVECMLKELDGKPESATKFAQLQCAVNHPNWKAELNAAADLAEPTTSKPPQSARDLLKSLGY